MAIPGDILALHCSLPCGYDNDGGIVLKYLGFHVYICNLLPPLPASITNPVVTVGLMLCFILLPIINHDFKIITNKIQFFIHDATTYIYTIK